MILRRVALAAVAALLFIPPTFAQGSPDLVISQVYGGGGNSGATLTNDYVEIFNRGAAPVSLGGKSVQYASATGTGNFGSSASQLTVLPVVTLSPGQYFLVQEAGGTTGSPLPAADAVGTINMSATAGKVALVNSTASLGCNGSSTPCSGSQLALIIDLVGFGGANFSEGTPAPVISATLAALRAGSGCTDTDNNGSDFTAQLPAPRNTSTPTHSCDTSLPTSPTASGVANPSSVLAGNSTLLTVTVTPGTNPASTGISVSANLTAIGGSSSQTFANAGGNTFTFTATVNPGTPAGPVTLPVTVTDAESRSGTASIALTISSSAPTNPTGTGTANPTSVGRGAQTQLTVTVTPGTNPSSTGITVTGDLSSIGGAVSQTFAGAGNVFTFTATVPVSTPLGGKSLPISITDAQGRSAATTIALTVTVPALAPGTIVISQFYGGGGNAGSTLHNDFIELFNRSDNAVSVDGWSVQHYSSSSPSPVWLATPLTGTIQPHSYYLVQEAAGTTAGGGTVPLPTPDAVGDIPMGSTAGLVALSTSSVVPSAMCSLTSEVIDFVGYGGTSCSGRVALGAGLSNTTGASRVLGGCKYTPAATDFTVGPPAPRNSATAVNDCSTVVEQFTPHVMISQIYGGGGNSSAAYNNDFVELYNPTDAAVSLEGWSIQYASSTGNGWGSNAQPLGGSIAPHDYFLIELASGGTASTLLPPPRIISDINMSGSNGKLALVSNFLPLSGNCPIGNPALVDFIGYGSADCFEGGLAAPSLTNNGQSLVRAANADTNQNSVDFSRLTPPNPRGTGALVELPPQIGSFDPSPTAAPYDASITLNFSEPVDVASGWYSIDCTVTSPHTDVEVASAFNSRTWIITPNQTFTPGETCTVHIFSNLVTDQDTNDPPGYDNLPADFQWSFTIATGTPVETADVHLTMGNPSSAIPSFATPNNYLMEKPEYALSYNRDHGTANWVSWHLTDEWAGTGSRTDTFRPDPALPPFWYRVLQTDYSGSGFDRGHMCPSADRNISAPINQATFLMTNMVPQSPDNNQGPWAAFETYLRTLIPCPAVCKEVYIVSGPYGDAGTIAGGHVTVPEGTWKVVLVLPNLDGNDVQRVTPSTTTIAIRIPNATGIRNDDWTKYLTTVRSIEQLTGYDFFSNVPKIVQNSIEAGTNGVNPPGVANETATTDEDQAVSVTLNAVSPDPAATFSYSINSSPSHGTLTGSGATYSYTPAPDFNGSDSFTFSVNDGHATSNTATFSLTVTPVNDPPVLTGVPATQTVFLGNTFDFTAHATDVDVPVQTIVFGLSSAPAGASIDAATGVFAWTPSGGQAGQSFTFSVTASDGVATTSAPVSVTVIDNAPPVISPLILSTSSLWPANHKMVDLTVSYTATDAGDPAPACSLSVTSNEPVNGTGDGDTTPDWDIVDAHHLHLRAERAAGGSGRVYTIGAVCTDRFSNVAYSATVTVSVPQSQGNGK